jgi:hypothetical protein
MGLRRILIGLAKWVYAICAAAAVLWLLGFGTAITSKIYWYAAIGAQERNISVLGSTSLAGRYTTLQITDHGKTVNFIFEQNEWDALLKTWQTAKAHQQTAWHEAGTMTESDVIGPSRLTVSAGTGVRFALADGGACLSYDVLPADFAAFDRAAWRGKQHFVDDSVDKELRPATADLKTAFHVTNDTMADMMPKTGPDCR